VGTLAFGGLVPRSPPRQTSLTSIISERLREKCTFVYNGGVFFGQTVPERSRLFLYVRAIRSAFFNPRRIQFDRSDFAPMKTHDETGRLATPNCLLFYAPKYRLNWKSTYMQCFVRFSNVYQNYR